MIGNKIAIVIAALALAAGACKNTSDAGKRESAPATQTPRPSARPAEQMLAAYERARVLLAGDQTSGLATAAAEIEQAAAAAASSAAPEGAEHLKMLATAANGLGTAADISAARLAFGEVSRHLVAILAADQTLAEGKHVFECPMAPGYQKWVQPTATLENPYMGQSMSSCGAASTWR